MARTHTMTPRMLAVLQYFARFRMNIPNNPMGWTEEDRCQRGIKKHGLLPPDKQAIGEAFHDLCTKNIEGGPWLIVHTSGKHYRITEKGLKDAARLSVKSKTITDANGPRDIDVVIETKTGRTPIIRSEETVDQIPDEDDDGDEVETVNLGIAPTAEDESERDPDTDPETLPVEPAGRDEINDPPETPPAPRRAPPTPAPAKRAAPAPAPKKPMTVKTAANPRTVPYKAPAHTKASVPGRG